MPGVIADTCGIPVRLNNGTSTTAPQQLPSGNQFVTSTQTVTRCQQVLAHAWMVRTFIKHSEEVEDFPELMDLPRTIFDMARALETRVNDPAAYLHMLRKKIGRLKSAAERFRQDAAEASTHTNFRQATISIDACVEQLNHILESATEASAS